MLKRRSSFSNVNDIGILIDTADTITFSNTNLNVASIAPGGAPRILYEPILLTGGVVSAIADGKHGVVNIGAAAISSNDTACVLLVNILISLNSDGDGTLFDGINHGQGIVGSDSVV